MSKQNSLYVLLRSHSGKNQQTNWREANLAQTELNGGWEIWKWNLAKVRMDKENCVVNCEFHYQMCEFLAQSKELKSINLICITRNYYFRDHLLPLNSLSISF